MGKGFDVNAPLRLFRQYTVRTSTTAGTATEKPADPQKPSRRSSAREFWKVNLAKLPKRANRRGKRRTNTGNASRRASQLLGPSADVDKEAYLRIFDGSDSSNEFSRPSNDLVRQPSRSATQLLLSPKPTIDTQQQPSRVSSEAELQVYQSGAPQFSVDGHDRLPKVTFLGLYSDDSPPPVTNQSAWHLTFAAATVGSHEQSWDAGQPIVRQSTSGPLVSKAREVPCMSSMAGLDPGAVGLKYFLQLPIADSNHSDDGPDKAVKRRVLAVNPELLGLRPLDVERLIDRLSELGDLEQQHKATDDTIGLINEQKAVEMYSDLFAKLLVPPKYGATAEQDQTGLNVQIEALIKVLGEPGLWHDFTIVEYRIRLGQLLWTTDEEAPRNQSEISNDRDVLLLQITLACELFIRLSALPNALDTNIKNLLTPRVAWDLVLAERFLDNVRIAPKTVSSNKGQNRSSLMSILSFVTAREVPDDSQVEPVLFPRHEQRQLDGLLQFANAIDWPHTDEIRVKMEERTKQAPALTWSAYATPVATPGFTASKRDSYFGATARPPIARMTTAQSVQLQPSTAYEAEKFGAGGWLSRSWLTGLVLPGEAASHFLISTVLENSPQALDSLGDSADLYGGFNYKGRSYWSKSCVVGRVLAAMAGARDCMGWISAPWSQTDGWINVDTKPVRLPTKRITDLELVGRDSALFPKTHTTELHDNDLTWPVDSPPILGNDVRYQGITFENSHTHYELSKDTASGLEGDIAANATSMATMTFASPTNGKLPKLVLPLTHDVYFVSSYPCFPKRRKQKTASMAGSPVEEKQLPVPPCHPLHTSYRYEVVAVASLLTSGESEIFNLEPTEKDGRTSGEKGVESVGHDTLILDCRGSADLEVLARAWCAKVGEHAVIGRSERTCMGCCVREACGLGIRVVVRI